VTSIDTLERTAARLDAFTAWVGRVVAYLGVATVLICFATVYLRYALGIGYVWLQESYIWTHCAAIMFGSSYAILQGGFVRVDMFYNRMSAGQGLGRPVRNDRLSGPVHPDDGVFRVVVLSPVLEDERALGL
jgi:hypothetical protein